MAGSEKSFKKCKELIIEAEEAVQCPCCFENKDTMVQCATGHHICYECMHKVRGICPICKNSYSGTKCFIAQDLARTISKIKILFDSVIDSESSTDDVEKFIKYRREIKAFLIDHSQFFNSLGASLAFFNRYLENPSEHQRNQLQKEFSTLNNNFKRIEMKMNNLEDGLKSLKLTKL